MSCDGRELSLHAVLSDEVAGRMNSGPNLRIAPHSPAICAEGQKRTYPLGPLNQALVWHTAGRKIPDRSHLISMRLKCLPGFKQRLQTGKNTWPSIGAGSVSGVILGPLIMRHRYFGGFGLGHQFDSCA